MASFQVQLEPEDDGIVVRLSGDASCVQVDSLRESLLPVLDHKGRWVVLELSGLQFINSLGLGVLVAFYKNLVGQGATLSFAGPTERIEEVLQTTRLTDLIPTYASLEEALAAN